MSIFEQTVLGNSLDQWLLAAGIALVGTIILDVAIRLVARAFRSLDKKLPSDFPRFLAETFGRTKKIILFIVAVYVASKTLHLPPALATTLRYVAVILIGVQVGVWAAALVTKLVTEYVIRQTGKGEVPSGVAVATLIARVIVWAFVILVVLDNLGFNITTLVAGLGVGGIAVAMASQNILADLFASLSILLDKPFKVGDFIIVGDLLGSVQNIGLKTTRLESLGGEQLVFSNADLLSSRIRNYKHMKERRVVFTVGVEYGTAYEKLERIPQMVKDIVESVQSTRFDRSHFMSYGDSSLNIETVYYVLSPDYNVYADVQQEINLKVFKTFEDEQINFAFPSRTLYFADDSPLVVEGKAPAPA